MKIKNQNGGFLMAVILIIIAIVILKFVFNVDIKEMYNYVVDVITFLWNKISGLFK